MSNDSESRLTATCIGFGNDVRLATRLLWKNKGFSSVILLTLALCIGANTAIFSLVYAMMIKPLPFPEPQRIVEIFNSYAKAGLPKMPSNLVQYTDYKQNATSYDAVGMFGFQQSMVGEDGALERTGAARGTADLFEVLAIKPLLGSFFTLENSQPGADKVVVLTQSYWQTRFHEDPGVIDQTIRIDGEAYKILGVAPRAVETFDARVKYFRPMAWTPDRLSGAGRHSLNTRLYARLKANVPVGQALAEAQAIEKRAYDAAPPPAKAFVDRAGHQIQVEGVQAELVKPWKARLYLLQGGVLCVLLIGCVNVANLLLARSNRRQGELAIRFALGAGRAAIARQLLVESLLLTLLGALLGVGVAWGAIKAINAYTMQLMPQMLPFTIDGEVLGLTMGVAVFVGLAIGLLPVVHTLRTDLMAMIHTSSRGASGGRGVRLLSSALVTLQVAFALVLLVGAGLLIHSFAKALAVDPGFEPANVITARLALPNAYRNEEANRRFQQELVTSLQEVPGFESVALSASTPFQGGLGINALTLKESTLPPDAPQPGAFQVGVSTGYATAMRLQLLDGRFFEEGDGVKDARRVYVVDERFAERYFKGGSAVGGRFTFGAPPAKDEDWPTIVGVVRNVPHNGVEDTSGIPFIYYPLTSRGHGSFTIFVRTARPDADAVNLIRMKLQAIDPSIPLFDTGTLEQAMDSSFASRRAVMWLLVGFAALALFLSAIGIYGVLAYDVSQRTREIGIRGAVGATREQVIGLIMTQGLAKTGIGLVIGLSAAFALSRFITSLLFDLKPTDPRAYIAVTVLLALVAAVSSYLPARRAAKINPNEALRTE